MSRRGRRASFRRALRVRPTGGRRTGRGGGRDHSRLDPYQRKAHAEGYRARSAYKLEQIHGRFNLLRPGFKVLDLGAAPGGWSQVASKLVRADGEMMAEPEDDIGPGPDNRARKDEETGPAPATPGDRPRRGLVVGIDLQAIQAWPGCVFLQGDLTDPATRAKVAELLPPGQAEVVLSDMSPRLSGNYDMDQARSIHLARAALEIACEWLRGGGSFVVKVFEGADFQEFRKELKNSFRVVRSHSPPASRKASSEIYLVAKGFEG